MDDEQTAVLALDCKDLEWRAPLIVPEEIQAPLVPLTGSVLEADPCAHDREESPRAGNSVTRRRPGPSDVLTVDPIIMSDNISAFAGADNRFDKEDHRVRLFEGGIADELVASSRRVQIDVHPGRPVLVGLDHRAVHQIDPVHPHEIGDIGGRKPGQRSPVGLVVAAPPASTELSIPSFRHAPSQRRQSARNKT